MSILIGRDDEFIMVQTGYCHALRFGELIGLEADCVTGRGIDVQWQLHQLSPGDDPELRAEAPGGFLRCPPKDGSTGLIVSPPIMTAMLVGLHGRAQAGEVPLPREEIRVPQSRGAGEAPRHGHDEGAGGAGRGRAVGCVRGPQREPGRQRVPDAKPSRR